MHFTIFVIVPVYNEEYHIQDVIRQLCSLKQVTILIVDDASSDNTVNILRIAGINFLQNKFQSGRDGAIKTGLEYYMSSVHKSDWVIIFDGDGQHSVEFIKKIIREPPQKVVFKGNRFSTNSPQFKTPADRLVLANDIKEYVFDELGYYVEDLNCGLLAMPSSIIDWVLKSCNIDKHFSVEICLKLRLEKKEYDLIEVTIPAIYDTNSQKHKRLYCNMPSSIRYGIRYISITNQINTILEKSKR